MKRICIIGSGPSGMYTAKYLLKSLGENVRIDIMEKLPVCYGLVRYGVAPDHPEVKSVSNDFDTVMSDSRVKFFGNVTLGKDVNLQSLHSMYDGVVLSYGAGADRHMGIPGEREFSNIWGARNFVNWYNGHPDCYVPEMPVPNLDHETAVVVGQGNVALDIARILTKNIDELAKTDISPVALDELSKSRVKKVIVLGRRGPAQAAFTIKELRELTKLQGVGCIIDPKGYEEGLKATVTEEVSNTRAKTRITQLIKDICANYETKRKEDKIIELRFLASPLAAHGNADGRVTKLEIQNNRLEGEPFHRVAKPIDGDIETLECGLLVRSIGYKSEPVDTSIPFDRKLNIIPNTGGKVSDGIYVSGWLKRGPSGIIGTNIDDARETVASILADFRENATVKDSSETLRDLIPGKVDVVDWNRYRRIDVEEQRRGQERVPVSERCKILTVNEMLQM